MRKFHKDRGLTAVHSIIIQPPLSARQQQRIADTTRERNKAQHRDDLKLGKHFDAPQREPESHKAGTTHEEEPKSSKGRATLSNNKSEPESTNKIIAFGQGFDRKEPKNLDAFLKGRIFKCHRKE
jgi:hypothetical protein